LPGPQRDRAKIQPIIQIASGASSSPA
jgi:hypothetical protein